MKKVIGKMAGFIFGAFGIGVFALLMSLTYQALQKLFPTNPANQLWGLIIYDLAAMCWAVAFVFLCKSVTQYAATGMGFIVALLGTLGMVAAEVILGGQTLIPAKQQNIGQWMVYGFIAVTAFHVIMIYVHHGAAPDIWEKIDIGIARSQVTDAAMKQATKQIAEETHLLADSLAQEIVNNVKRDLHLPIPIKDTVFDRRHEADTVPFPILQPPPDQSDYTGIAPELYAKGTRFTDPADQARHDAYHATKQDEPTSAQPPFPVPPFE